MMHQFPQHYSLPQPYQTHPSPPGEHSQSQIIEQLRRENEMLKQQLQAVLRMQANSPSPSPSLSPALTPRNNHLMPLPHAQNQEDEAETAYRNKMSKLKTRKSKSNRKSFDNSATAPVSPQGSFLGQERPYSRQPHPVPKLVMAEPKMMVISKDKEGKFFRDRSKEQHLATVRKTNISQERRPIQHVLQTNKENSFARAPRGNHQRVESALPMGNFDRKERIYQQITPVPSMAQIPQRPDFIRSPQHHHMKSQPNEGHRQVYPFPPPNNAHVVQLPRGHVYVERAEQQKGRTAHNRKESTGDFISEGDSRLSIEMDLRNARSARRLKYDIYMEEDRL